MAGSDKRKQSLYFPEDMLKEIQDEATRQDRSLFLEKSAGKDKPEDAGRRERIRSQRLARASLAA